MYKLRLLKMANGLKRPHIKRAKPIDGGADGGFNLKVQTTGLQFEQKVTFMTAKAATYKAYDRASFQALALLFGLTAAVLSLLPLLALNGTLLLRLP